MTGFREQQDAGRLDVLDYESARMARFLEPDAERIIESYVLLYADGEEALAKFEETRSEPDDNVELEREGAAVFGYYAEASSGKGFVRSGDVIAAVEMRGLFRLELSRGPQAGREPSGAS